MAKCCRIDSAAVLANGTVSIQFTIADTPLSPAVGGSGINYSSKQDLVDAIYALETSLVDDQKLVLFAISAWLKSDPQLQNPSLAVGQSVTIDLTGATSPIIVS